jgi:hypothetical protein
VAVLVVGAYPPAFARLGDLAFQVG